MRLIDEVIVFLFARLFSIVTKHSFIVTMIRIDVNTEYKCQTFILEQKRLTRHFRNSETK